MFKSFFTRLFGSSYSLNCQNLQALARRYGPNGKWLDLGCDDGKWTLSLSPTANWYGVEMVSAQADLARKAGVKVSIGSLETKLPFKNHSFALVHSNQVLEHLTDLDIFISEISRVLKPGGILLISTENPASWHNIFALILGWQMFSLTNISTKALGIGNPLALHRGKNFSQIAIGRTKAWEHNKLLTPQALQHLLRLYGFKILESRGAGYYPLPAWVGLLDVNHSHFYSIAAVKI